MSSRSVKPAIEGGPGPAAAAVALPEGERPREYGEAAARRAR
jgi:hypothetical protein